MIYMLTHRVCKVTQPLLLSKRQVERHFPSKTWRRRKFQFNREELQQTQFNWQFYLRAPLPKNLSVHRRKCQGRWYSFNAPTMTWNWLNLEALPGHERVSEEYFRYSVRTWIGMALNWLWCTRVYLQLLLHIRRLNTKWFASNDGIGKRWILHQSHASHSGSDWLNTLPNVLCTIIWVLLPAAVGSVVATGRTPQESNVSKSVSRHFVY